MVAKCFNILNPTEMESTICQHLLVSFVIIDKEDQ